MKLLAQSDQSQEPHTFKCSISLCLQLPALQQRGDFSAGLRLAQLHRAHRAALGKMLR